MCGVNFNSMLEALQDFLPQDEYSLRGKSDVQFLFTQALEESKHKGRSDVALEKIQSVLEITWEELNTGHWSQVSLEQRKFFSLASLIKIIALIQKQVEEGTERRGTDGSETLKQAIGAADRGLLLGSGLHKELTHAANIMTAALYRGNIVDGRSLSFEKDNPEDWNFKGIKGEIVPHLSCPSLEHFSSHYFNLKKPAKLSDCISHWPALKKWSDMNYLLKMAGPRTVPVEIGSSYTQSDWGMKLSTLHDFISKHIISKSDEIGYLAQHQLFNQIPELKADIRVPEYCCLSEYDDSDGDVDINAWFGPACTVSPLHFDPKHNLLTQVIGRKRVILYPPEDSDYLYPHEGKMLHNSAQVDPYSPDYVKYPNYTLTKPLECHLYPGDMLYIPPKWWHHVRSLDISFSVSFWWE